MGAGWIFAARSIAFLFVSFSALAPLWDVVAPPLRPSPEDLVTFRRGAGGRTLVLGATAELLALNSEAFGFDACKAMVERGEGRVRLGDWAEMPLDSRSIDGVLGDGSLSAVGDELARRGILSEIRRVLRPEGIVILRTYTRPNVFESGEPEVIGNNVNAFKLWLWSRVSDASGIVRIDDVWREWRALPEARRSIFSEAERASVECYEGSTDSYWVPTLGAMREFFEENHFVLEELVFSTSYPLAERCPLAILRGAS